MPFREDGVSVGGTTHQQDFVTTDMAHPLVVTRSVTMRTTMEIRFTTFCVILGFFVSSACDIYLYMSVFIMLLYYMHFFCQIYKIK